MSVDSFKFVSPGVQINEIDNSGVQPLPGRPGPAIIGRFERGPSNRPVTVSSMAELIEVFGNPIPGGKGGDVWREGNYLAPNYGAYAAMAYLRNAAPITVVRVLGEAHDEAESAGNGPAGWALDNAHVANTSVTPAAGGGAFGLFLFSSGSTQLDFTVDQAMGTTETNVIAADTSGKMNRRVHRSSAKTTGSLAAVWYFDAGAIELSGTLLPGVLLHTGSTAFSAGGGPGGGFGATAGNSIAIRSSNTATMEFTTVLFDNSNTGTKVKFNFDRTSDNYIRKVFNTNPTLAGSQVTNSKKYWLGETFDRHVRDTHGSTLNQGLLTGDSSLYGVIVGLQGTENWASNQKSTQPSKTGWFISQDPTSNTTKFSAVSQQKLFRLVGLDDGEWGARNIKVSVVDLKGPTDVDPYGSFSVILRHVRDNDGSQQHLERFSNCNLNPNSVNYLGAKIGDMYQDWDNQEARYRSYGTYPNNSKFVRVEMNADVDEGLVDPSLIPFGFIGPPRYKSVTLGFGGLSRLLTGGGDAAKAYRGGMTIHSVHSASSGMASVEGTLLARTLILTSGSVAEGAGIGLMKAASFSTTSPFKTSAIFAASVTSSATITGVNMTASAKVTFPKLPLRVSASSDGLRSNKLAHWGVMTSRSPSSTRFDESYLDVVRGGQGISADVYDAGSTTENSFVFTLDDIVGSENVVGTSLKNAYYKPGSRRRGDSYTAMKSVKELLKSGFTKFTSPMYGGFDGLNIKEREPLGHHVAGVDGATFKGNYAANSYKRGVDSVSEPEVVDINLISAPGVRAPLVTDHVIRVAEDRGDCMAIIDLEKGGYQPASETTSDFKTRISNNKVKDCVETLEQRGLNTSYAAAYFPWVKIYDDINAQQVWVPPSVVALGTMASTERNAELWFAPAGFTRGGLSRGSAGIAVLATSQRLSAQDRDDLYRTNVNPIAQFPAEGIVVFGQKTLSAKPSALDRINVRRLVVYLKKQISRVASTLLFEPNVQSTWNRFRGQVEPFLQQVKAGYGLEEYKVVLDESTTTPDLVDRNVMYAKIFIKPAKALEFIAIDFVITNNGAAFDD